MKSEIVVRLFNRFEESAHEQGGVEYWFARELQPLLGYLKWENFFKIVEKAKIACQNAGQLVADHFLDVGKMVDIGSQTQRNVEDIMGSIFIIQLFPSSLKYN